MSDFDKDSDSNGCTRCGNIPSQSNAFKHLPEPTIQALSSFNTYSSTQREQIASAVTRIKEEQSKVDDVIDRTQAYLKHLLSEREMLSSALYKQQFLLSSIRNLPDEILSKFFYAYGVGAVASQYTNPHFCLCMCAEGGEFSQPLYRRYGPTFTFSNAFPLFGFSTNSSHVRAATP